MHSIISDNQAADGAQKGITVPRNKKEQMQIKY